MIALLAAVPQETRRIREEITDLLQESACGMIFHRGTLSGVEVCLAHSGIGKAAAAAASVSLVLHCQPQAVLLFGCGGAYPNAKLEIGSIAIASEEVFGDEGVTAPGGFQNLAEMKMPMREAPLELFNRWPVDPELAEWAERTIADGRLGPFVTVSTCSGTEEVARMIEERTGGICENMEGAGAALACHQMSVPLLEVRGISNIVEDRNTDLWDLPAGMTAAQQAILRLITAWQER